MFFDLDGQEHGNHLGGLGLNPNGLVVFIFPIYTLLQVKWPQTTGVFKLVSNLHLTDHEQ